MYFFYFAIYILEQRGFELCSNIFGPRENACLLVNSDLPVNPVCNPVHNPVCNMVIGNPYFSQFFALILAHISDDYGPLHMIFNCIT